MRKIILPLLVAITLPAFAGSPQKAVHHSSQAPRPKPQAQKPSLLLITLDTTRADHLGCYGYKLAQTPNLDALAARGVRFENAWASAPITLSSHATIMTGTFPVRHGARDNGLFKLNPDVETLAQVLKKNGYQTAAFVSAAVLDRQFGLNKGFDYYDDNVRVGEQRAFAYQERAANQVTEAVSDYLPRLKKNGKPFFLWVHYYDAHYPYVAPNPFKTQFAKNPYDGEIAFVDQNIGFLFEELKKQGLDQNLYTVAVGDHGEMLGEHGEPNHGVFLYKSALHVPLIIAGPALPGGGGESIKDNVRLVDLAPTLSDLLIRPAHEPSAKYYELPRGVLTNSDGISFLPPLNGATGYFKPGYQYEETYMPYFSYGLSPLMGIRSFTSTDAYHFIEAPKPELYELNADPDEKSNLLLHDPDGKMHADWSKALAHAITESTKPGSKPNIGLPIPNANADPALLKSLAQLGYVGNAGGGTENLPDPKDAIDLVVKLRKGEDLSANGKHADAAAIYEEVIRRAPSNFNGYGLLANERLALNQPAEALRVYHTALKLNGRLEFLRLGEATTLAELKDPSAEGKLRSLIKDNPRNADFFMAYYEFLHQKGRHDEARADLEAALKAGHDDAEIRYRLGEEEFRRKHLPAAEAQFRKAVAFNKWHSESLARLGELTAKKDPEVAREFYLRAIEERPDRMDWRNAMMALPGK